MCCICRNSACYREHSFVFWAVTMVLSRPPALSCIPTTNVLGTDIFTLSDARVCLHRRHPDRGKGTAYCRFDMFFPDLQHGALYFMVTTCFYSLLWENVHSCLCPCFFFFFKLHEFFTYCGYCQMYDLKTFACSRAALTPWIVSINVQLDKRNFYVDLKVKAASYWQTPERSMEQNQGEFMNRPTSAC